MLDNKQILLIVSGGIAAYKSLSLVRMIQENGGSVKAVLTKAGSKFITNLSLSALTGNGWILMRALQFLKTEMQKQLGFH